MSLTLLIAGGGTGGHVFPGIAVAEAWQERHPDTGVVVFCGSETGLEARLVPAAGYRFEAAPARRLKNTSAGERARNLMALPGTVWAGAKVVRRIAPDVVLGVGGYVSGPVVLGAALDARPCTIAEQNALPGLTNRILARVSRRIYTAFPEAARAFPRHRVRMLGNPVRSSIQRAASKARPVGGRRVLIMGGSQGAEALNQKLPKAIAEVAARMGGLEVRHQTGALRDQAVRDRYDALGLPARVEPFIDDMASALCDADLVVARAGATTVAELACVGRPSLLIPFPFAADDHQTHNARSLVDAGAARLVAEQDLDGSLVDELCALLSFPDMLARMGERAKERGRPNAAAEIVEDLTSLCSGGA